MASNIRVLLEPTAETELDEAMSWYDRRAGLGRELAQEVDKCIERIRGAPEMYARVKKNYRRAMVDRFPYSRLLRIRC
jgi:toxin ParE1/3/4